MSPAPTSTPQTGVIITGGGSGIGRATALALAAVGRPVALWDLDEGKAKDVAAEVADQHGVGAVGVGLDVQDHAAFGPAIIESRNALGAIGGLVHAAGIPGVGAIDSFESATWNMVIGIHLTAAAVLIRELAPDLTGNADSAVVLISSIEGIICHPAIPAYCSAKAGLLGLARSSGAHLGKGGEGKHGVRVNAICPGFIETPMLAPAMQLPGTQDMYANRIPVGRLGQPDEIGKVARFLLSTDASYINCAEIVVDGGVSKTTF
jgi:NAD(P)-dependent dehydrogenase (short-subunit alcohol dehydrogenase family)